MTDSYSSIGPIGGGAGGAPTNSPTFTGTVTMPDASTFTTAGLNSSVAIGVGAAAPAAGILDASNGAASQPAFYLTGTNFTGGNGTTTFPQFLVQPNTATASTTWATTGTLIGANGHTGLGNLMDLKLDGTTQFSVASNGSVLSAGNLIAAATGVLGVNTRGILSSPAAGKWQMGNTDAAAPVAQTLQAQSVVAGNTNTAGATLTIAGSKSNGSGGGDVVMQTTLSAAGSGVQNTLATALTLKGGTQAVIAAAALTSASPSGGVGYSTGAGGTVTQATNKSTGVTLNTTSGQITMNNASLAAQSEVSFTLSDTSIAATDVVVVSIASGATANSYVVGVAATAAGSCVFQLGNVTLATPLTDAVVLNFVVIKGVTA